MTAQRAVSLDAVRMARQTLDGIVPATPLVRYNGEAGAEIFLKLENLQPVGSFKCRGAMHAICQLSEHELAGGVWTASAGNMGYALAWSASRMGTPCTVVVPEDAPSIKVQAILGQGAQVVSVPFPIYQQIQSQKQWADNQIPMPEGLHNATLVHPFADPAMMAGNGGIGLEVMEQYPEVDAVIVPYGGGGLSCGIAAALRELRPGLPVFAAEVESGAPLAASLAAGEQVRVEYRPSFISGMGAPYVFDEMWPLAKELLAGSLVVSVAQAAEAVQLLVQHNKVVAEGAGAVALAAALTVQDQYKRIVSVVSGGNIAPEDLSQLLNGALPR